MRTVASWNVNSLRVRLGQLRDWLAANPVDVLGLQETKLEDEHFPREELHSLGYQALFCGQKSYNGVALLARESLDTTCIALPGFEDPQRRVVAASVGGVRYVNLYVPNGQSVGSEKYEYKLRWLAALREWLAREISEHPHVVVMGDFNIAPDDRDVYDPAGWAGQIQCSEPERGALRALVDLGLSDTFRLFDQEERSFSWWDYRMAGFRRNLGLRIDLILASRDLATRCIHAAIDKTPRKLERPSDHAPVIARFDI